MKLMKYTFKWYASFIQP